MSNLEIFCLDKSELKEFDSINRGYRGDIYIKEGNDYYNLNFYDIVRLKQDFEQEIKYYGIFSPDPNIIIVNEVNEGEIKSAIKNLNKIKYFDQIKAISENEISELNFFKF